GGAGRGVRGGRRQRVGFARRPSRRRTRRRPPVRRLWARRAGTRRRLPGVRRSCRSAPPPGRSRRARAGQLGEIRAAEGVAMRHPRAVMSQLPGDCPVTWAVLGANVLTFAVAFVGGGGLLGLACDAAGCLESAWSGLTSA